eukprot:1156183-Pelagomonas_calceolata.AAC.4
MWLAMRGFGELSCVQDLAQERELALSIAMRRFPKGGKEGQELGTETNINTNQLLNLFSRPDMPCHSRGKMQSVFYSCPCPFPNS